MCIASFKRTLVLLFALIGLTATISSAADYAIAHVTVINPGRGKSGRPPEARFRSAKVRPWLRRSRAPHWAADIEIEH